MTDRPLVWMACDCHIWPIDPLQSVGRCKLCGVRPERHVPEPEDGKAVAL